MPNRDMEPEPSALVAATSRALGAAIVRSRMERLNGLDVLRGMLANGTPVTAWIECDRLYVAKHEGKTHRSKRDWGHSFPFTATHSPLQGET